MTNITLTILSKNSLDNLKSNFKWVEKVPNINQIIIVEDNSSNVDIAPYQSIFPKNLLLLNRSLNNDFASQRQFAVSHSTNDWILWLDTDETPSTKLINFLQHFEANNTNYTFKRHDKFIDRILTHGENSHNKFLRLFNKNNGKFLGKVHEVWKSTSTVVDTDLLINHFPHPDLDSFYRKINFYSSIRAQELFDLDVKTNLLSIIFYPLAKFTQIYIFYFGFLDGTPGIIMALGMSFHSFLVRAKLWQLQQK